MKLIDGPMQAMYVLSTSKQGGSGKNKKKLWLRGQRRHRALCYEKMAVERRDTPVT